jgi:hypothetical protein
MLICDFFVFRRGVIEDFRLLRCDIPSVGEWISTFRNIVLPSLSMVSNKRVLLQEGVHAVRPRTQIKCRTPSNSADTL